MGCLRVYSTPYILAFQREALPPGKSANKENHVLRAGSISSPQVGVGGFPGLDDSRLDRGTGGILRNCVA